MGRQAVLALDLAAEPQEQKHDHGPVLRCEPRQHYHTMGQCSFSHSRATIARRYDGPPTPPPEFRAIWNSRAELVRARQKLAQQLNDDARRKGTNLLSFALEDMNREWEAHAHHSKEDFNASESRRLRLVRKELLLHRRMCLLSSTAPIWTAGNTVLVWR